MLNILIILISLFSVSVFVYIIYKYVKDKSTNNIQCKNGKAFNNKCVCDINAYILFYST